VSPANPSSEQLIYVLSPVFNDVESWTLLRKRVLEELEGAGVADPSRVRFVVVDDTGGLDPAIPSLAGMPDTTIISPPFNVGHQRAIVYGSRKILDEMPSDALLVTMDADGEDRPEDVPRLVTALLESPPETAMAIAERTQRQERLKFRVFYAAFKVLFRIATGARLRSGNFAVHRTSHLRKVIMHPYFDLAYASALLSLPVRRHFVPCPRGKRYFEVSRLGFQGLQIHGLRLLMPFVEAVALRALVALFVIFAAGLVGAATAVAIRLFTTVAIPGWATQVFLGAMAISVIAIGNFIVLFAVFSQSRGITLSGMERDHV
jgi:polyisoprenyl-phosphate glycosyltransferase